MSESENNETGHASHSNSIIKNHMIWSMGAGFIPIPVVDFLAVTGIQLDMIRQLCKVYEVDFKETEGKAIISALTGSGLARLGARAVKFIPGLGSIIGGITLSVLSGASTFAVGEVFKTHFETGGTFLDFDPERLKKFYDEKFEKGKQMAKDIEPKAHAAHQAAEEVVMNHEDRKEGAISNTTVTVKPNVKLNQSTDKKPAAGAPKAPPVKDFMKQLESITKMKSDGMLTEEEFNVLKGKIIDAQKNT